MNHNLLLEIQLPAWATLLNMVFGSAGVVTIILWIRFRRKDAADVRVRESVVHKNEAESDRLKAEAYKVKAEADITIVDTAVKLAQRLSEECDMAKREIKEKNTSLEKTQMDLDSVKQSLRDALRKCNELQEELDKEKQKNTTMSETNDKMQKEIELLKSQLSKFKSK